MNHSNKRIAIFSHYDKHGLIDNYVLYYLEGLKEVCNDIIFVSDCDIDSEQLEKIHGLVLKTIIGRHGEYDFGSYKRGFFAIQDIDKYDEIVFCNDSCYGPFYDFNEMFDIMTVRNLDFWGITQNHQGYCATKNHTHVQSYFLVIKKQVFKSPVFEDFMFQIKAETNKINVVINYEIGLTQSMIKLFRFDSYVPADREVGDLTISTKWKQIIKNNKCPLAKVKKLKIILLWKNFIHRHTDYPTSLIRKHQKRIMSKKEKRQKGFRPIAHPIASVLNFCHKILRKTAKIILFR